MNAKKTQTIELPQTYSDFRSYLEQSLRNPFILDLSDADLKTVIQSCIATKSKLNPKYGASMSSLVTAIEYIEKLYRITLVPKQVTDIFWTYFVGLLQQKGLKNSTISTLANQLRAVLRWGTRYNVEISPSFDMLRIPANKSFQIALSEDEVSQIYHFDVQLFYRDKRPQYRKRMEQVRDMFTLSCNLYQRHSDMVRIDRTCFNRNIFRITQLKTGSIAIVDIDKMSVNPKATYAILEKYGYNAPYIGDLSNYNSYLHELMKDVGLCDDIRIEERVNGEIETTIRKKYEMIASHTARRTAISIAYFRNKSTHDIRKCSGHQSLDMLEKYIKERD